jgi:hypothetical protein
MGGYSIFCMTHKWECEGTCKKCANRTIDRAEKAEAEAKHNVETWRHRNSEWLKAELSSQGYKARIEFLEQETERYKAQLTDDFDAIESLRKERDEARRKLDRYMPAVALAAHSKVCALCKRPPRGDEATPLNGSNCCARCADDEIEHTER